MNARLARILTIDDYDTKEQTPKLDALRSHIDNGATVQDESIEDNLRKYYDKKEDVVTVFLALQRQNFALTNALKDLIENSIII